MTLTSRVLAAVEDEPGSTAVEVAADLGAPLHTVSSRLLALVLDGRLVRQRTRGRWSYRPAPTPRAPRSPTVLDAVLGLVPMPAGASAPALREVAR